MARSPRRLSPLERELHQDDLTDIGSFTRHESSVSTPRPETIAVSPHTGEWSGRTSPVSADEDSADDEPLPIYRLKVTQPVLNETREYFCSRAPEAAGILIGPTSDPDLITHFVPDVEGKGTPAMFHLNAPHLNQVLKSLKPAGLSCHGLVHSHPARIVQPSYGDLAYLRKLFAAPANAAASHFYVPIVCDGRLYAYVYARDQIIPADLVLV